MTEHPTEPASAAPEYTKQYYDDAKIDRMIRESAYYIDDKQTNARQHLVAIIRQLRTERDDQRRENAALTHENELLRKMMTE